MIRNRTLIFLIGLICLILLVSCARPTPRPAPTRPPTMATRIPAPVPIPTLGPVAVTPDLPPLWGLRSVSAPAAPVLSSGDSAVVNLVCVGDCYTGGGPSWVTSDVTVEWSHADPLTVDEYEVWTAVDEPYFDPATCAACELDETTTGLAATVIDAPPGFNPVGGTDGANLMSRIQTFTVRATNAGGTSAQSNAIGVVHFSLVQGGTELPDFGQ